MSAASMKRKTSECAIYALDGEVLLTAAEAARTYRVSYPRIQNDTVRGRLVPHGYVGTMVLFRKSVLSERYGGRS